MTIDKPLHQQSTAHAGTTTSDLPPTAAHELAHALVGRAQGWRIRSISILRGGGAWGRAEHFPRTDLSAFEDALGNAVICLAGDLGGMLVGAPDGWREPEVDAADIERIAETVLAALPADERAFLAWVRTAPSTGNDATKAEALAEAAGAEKAAFLYFARERSRRLVTELAPMIGALIPTLVERRLMTGDQLEEAITALAGDLGDR
ncbi:MAG TPA: hypothetical protein VMW94_02385 [Actinomycetes bacterium]|nr:hypothetical protein [Actinomycetes bacterium]